MKRIVSTMLGLGVAALAAGPVNAALQIGANLGTDVWEAEPNQAIPTGTAGFINGLLSTTTAAEYRFTYLGAGTAQNLNAFITIGGNNFCNFGIAACSSTATPIGTSFTLFLGAGVNVPFSYQFDLLNGTGGHTLVNGDSSITNGAYLVQIGLGTTANAGPGNVAYLGLTDNPYSPSLDHDFQDLSVRVEVVPEPSTWMMMIGGLGLLGFMAKRRARMS